MPLNIKELIVILGLSAVIFHFWKPIALLVGSEQNFSRRRNVWTALTAAAFLCPSFWFYSLLAIPIIFVAARKDTNPSALYLLLLHVIPPLAVTVPMIGISRLFDINNYIMLSLFVLLPVTVSGRRTGDAPAPITGLQFMDLLLLAFGTLQAFFFVLPETSIGVLSAFTFSDALRRIIVFLITVFVPYYAISRSAAMSRPVIIEIMATYCLSCALMAAIAVFESGRHWLLYAEIADRWGVLSPITPYMARGESLRATVTAGQPLALGYLFVIGFGFWLCLQKKIAGWRRPVVTVLLIAGLIATYSRGPWIGAVVLYVIFVLASPKALSNLAKLAGYGAIALFAASFTEVGQHVLNLLPVIGGNADAASLTYRQRLFDRAWLIIQDSPLLGDPYALLKMPDLRQGQQIIDLVNTYLDVLLDSGFIGLSLFLGFIVLALHRAAFATRRIRSIDPDISLIGTTLLACLSATVLLLWDASFLGAYQIMFYVLAALATAYASMARTVLVPEKPSIKPQRRL